MPRQIIGIFQQPSFSSNPACGGNCEYIAGSYVKWIESAGGRVVPLPYNASTAYLDSMFEGLNGLLLPGGSSVVSEAAIYMVEKAFKANKEGDFFPVRRQSVKCGAGVRVSGGWLLSRGRE